MLQCFHHTTKIYPRHNSNGTNVSWITRQEISKQRKHDVEQKCSYFCVGCLSPNSLMLSCKESWRQKRGETLGSVWGWKRGSRVSPCSQDNYSTFSSRKAVTSAHPCSCPRRSRPQWRAYDCLLVFLFAWMWPSQSDQLMFFWRASAKPNPNHDPKCDHSHTVKTCYPKKG